MAERCSKRHGPRSRTGTTGLGTAETLLWEGGFGGVGERTRTSTRKNRTRPSTPQDPSQAGRNIRLHVLPYIGSIPLQRLAPEDLDDLYAHLLSNGRRNKGGGALSPKTVRLVHSVIHKALADAHRKSVSPCTTGW